MRTRRDRGIERERQRAVEDGRVWAAFIGRLERVTEWKEAHVLADSGPGPRGAGRQYYSNLQFFLDGLKLPNGSNDIERKEYLRLVRKWDAAGALKEGVLVEFEEGFRSAAEPRY